MDNLVVLTYLAPIVRLAFFPLLCHFVHPEKNFSIFDKKLNFCHLSPGKLLLWPDRRVGIVYGFLILSLNQQFTMMVNGESAYFEHVIVCFVKQNYICYGSEIYLKLKN